MPIFQMGINQSQIVFYDIEADDEEQALERLEEVMKNEEPSYISGPFQEGEPFVGTVID